MTHDIYDPEFVAGVFDRCSGAYRNWSAIASFGLIRAWRKSCIDGLTLPHDTSASGVDLMAGTGEAWPHLFARFPKIEKVTAIDISPGMHRQALKRLHMGREDRVSHLCANMLTTDLPNESADFAISTFGLKTFNADQHLIFARQLRRILKPGAPFSLIEATDPVGWSLRPLYRLYLDGVLPQIERLFLNGAQDFTMIGEYTRNFGSGGSVADALKSVGLNVDTRYYVYGSAIRLSGHKPD
ncbi:ubiquinone biosynthesis methyltransferase UbiE [Ruegeria sp. ANG-R]|uniref:class I SAM-dependent methyltransferase n=1 Tax=Ruegeria sp. ANG-R TaxID=1577903 RepID=UPI00057F0058|nr:class I SAM-dependent methyltransferase [Ruegeria sp. ANG-R]KIC42070.1 ubiquinone biosynthesis methyltransferase UbiE [Ruegeria sp. ANG-R]